MITTNIAEEELLLHPFKAIFWPRKSILLLADLHLGKATHFRKAGIAVPSGVSDANWDRLSSLLLEFSPSRVIILGDLFHSTYNREWEDLAQLISQFEKIQFELVIGNHDILSPGEYERIGMKVHAEPFRESPFLLTHHPIEDHIAEGYNLSGHIHPCVRMKGRGHQYLRLPCFWFGKKQAILPAFGAFTGMAAIKPHQGDQVFVIAEDEVLQVG